MSQPSHRRFSAWPSAFRVTASISATNLDDVTLAELRYPPIEPEVLMFPGQHLTADCLVAFAGGLGHVTFHHPTTAPLVRQRVTTAADVQGMPWRTGY